MMTTESLPVREMGLMQPPEHPKLTAAREAVLRSDLRHDESCEQAIGQPCRCMVRHRVAALDELIRIAQLVGRAEIDCENPTTTCYCLRCTVRGEDFDSTAQCSGGRLCDSCYARTKLAALASP